VALKNWVDAAFIRDRIGAWLPEVIDVTSPVEIGAIEIPIGSGMSSESALLDATWRKGGTRVTKGFVLRIAPNEGGLFRVYDIEREAKFMNAVAEHTEAPARVLARELTGKVLGKRFLLVERLYGKVPTDDPLRQRRLGRGTHRE
jgi:aminoglycoside phosphotransferase (APT) family kinase protein